MKIEILCGDEDPDRIADAIVSAAGSGEIGDGKIWVAPVSRAIRIRTGEVGREAV